MKTTTNPAPRQRAARRPLNAPFKTAAAAAALAAAALLGSAAGAAADEIRLKDGTVVHGILAGLEGDILSITPGFNADGSVKTFKFKMADVLTFSSNDPIFIGTGGAASQSADNVAHGRVEPTPGAVKIVTSSGTVTVPLEQVKIAYRTRDDSPEAKALKEMQRKWTVEFFADLRGREGTSRQLGASGGFTAVNSGKNDALTLYAKYNYSRSRENKEKPYTKAADDGVGGIDYKMNLTDVWFWYARTAAGFNKINFVRFYSESAAGGGVNIINQPKHKLDFRLGAAFRYEAYGRDDDGVQKTVVVNDKVRTDVSMPALEIGMNYMREWTWGRFTDKITYLPGLVDFDYYLIHHEAVLELPVANSRSWFVQIGVTNDYNSRPAEGVKKLDTTYFMRVVYRFAS
ncbi:MAG: DUF481 domain-containing protein [Puniceicoccales bacterium]|nr:DUF481 domain-containing protein [Puniceicoccales bacterium]